MKAALVLALSCHRHHHLSQKWRLPRAARVIAGHVSMESTKIYDRYDDQGNKRRGRADPLLMGVAWPCCLGRLK